MFKRADQSSTLKPDQIVVDRVRLRSAMVSERYRKAL